MLSPALKIKKQQGHHGIKGASVGSQCGKASLDSAKYKNYQQRRQKGLIPDDKKPGRRPSKTPGKRDRKRKRNINDNDEYVPCMKNLTFVQQLELIDVYHKLRNKLGGNVSPKVDAMREYFGAERFNEDYSSENAKAYARKRLGVILNDEIRLKIAVLCGMGQNQKWTEGAKANNPCEDDIAKQLKMLKSNEVKITARLITNVALRITSAAGIKCQWTKDCDDLISILDKKEIEENMKIINESQSNANINEKYKNVVFSPSQTWRSRFMNRYNFGHGNESGTQTNIVELMTQMEPPLTITYALRKLYNIPGGEGRIKNAYQSMFYRFYDAKKSWNKK